MRQIKHVLPLSICIAFLFSSCSNNQPNTSEDWSETESDINMTLSTSSEQAKASFGEGINEFYLGDRFKAHELFEEAITADSAFAIAHMFRSYSSNNFEDAITNLKKAKDLSSNTTEAEKMLIDMTHSFLTDDPIKRRSIGESLVEKYPMNFIGRMELANAYFVTDRIEESREQLLQAIADFPEKGGPLLTLTNSFIFYDPIDLNKAERYAKRSVEVFPDMPGSHIKLGDVYRAQNKLNDALAVYKRASEIDPDNYLAISMQGHVNSFLGNYEEARSDYAEAEELTDHDNSQLNFMILTYVYDGNHDEALRMYNEEIDKLSSSASSDMFIVRSNLIWSALHVANYAGNSGMFESLLTLYEESMMQGDDIVDTDEWRTSSQSILKYWGAHLAIMNNEINRAKTLMDEYFSLLQPLTDRFEINNYQTALGMIAIAENDPETAISHLKKGNSDNVYTRYQLAKALEMNGQVDEAMEHYDYLSTFNFNNTNFALIRSECQSKIASL